MREFKIGDRVKSSSYGMGAVIGVCNNGVRYLIGYDNEVRFGHSGYGMGRPGHCLWTRGENLEKVEDKKMKSEIIVIYRKGKETIAFLQQDNKVVRKAAAKCSPDDTYDFKIGAYIAHERLMGESVKAKNLLKELEAKVEKEIAIGDIVEVVNSRHTYNHYVEWIRKNAPGLESKFKYGETPKDGLRGIVMAIAPHELAYTYLLYAVLINGQIYIIQKSGIKLCEK